MNKSVKNGLVVGGLALLVLICSVFLLKNNDNGSDLYLTINKVKDGQQVINNKFSYKALLPDDWIIERRSDGTVSAIDGYRENEYCKIETYDLSLSESQKSLDEWIQTEEDSLRQDQEIASYKIDSTKIDGKDAKVIYITSAELGTSKAVILKKNNIIFQFVLYPIEKRNELCNSQFDIFLKSIDFFNEDK